MAVYCNVCSQSPTYPHFKLNSYFYPQHTAQHLVYIRFSKNIVCLNNTCLTLQGRLRIVSLLFPIHVPYQLLRGQGPCLILSLILPQQVQHKENEYYNDLRGPWVWILHCLQLLLLVIPKKSGSYLQTECSFFLRTYLTIMTIMPGILLGTTCGTLFFHPQNIFPKRHATDWKEIFVKHIYDKGLVSGTCKELWHLNYLKKKERKKD